MAYISRTPAGDGNLQKFTISMWIKRGDIGVASSNTNSLMMQSIAELSFYNTDTLKYYMDGTYGVTPSRLFRDVTGWMHICIATDTTSASALAEADRIKVYINGVRETEMASTNYPPLGTDSRFGDASYELTISKATDVFYGNMSWVQFVDNAALAPTEFGEEDATSGMWKIKTTPYATPGTNGFCLKMEDGTNMDLDSSSNAYTFATTGDITLTQDTPSNNFCTLSETNANTTFITYTNGNTTAQWSDSTVHTQGTIGMQGGKWYWEIEINENNGEYGVCENGRAFQRAPTTNFPFYFATNPGTTTTTVYNNQRTGSNSSTFTGTSHEIGDVVMMAYDATNGNLYYGKNRSWENSGDPTSGASATGAIVTSIQERWGGLIVPFQGSATASSRTWKYNFGNGYFGTTSHGETNSDTAGIGLFKYSVPTGYYALCSKNVKTQGGI